MQITSLLDLVMHYPRRWVDRTNECRVEDLLPGVQALVVVEVLSVDKRMTRNRRSMITVRVGDATGKFTLTFFNQPWRDKQLTVGLTISVWGKADTYRGTLQMTNPIVDLIGDRTGKIVPIYPQSEKAALSTWEIAGWVEDALHKCEPRGIADPLPADVLRRLGLLPRLGSGLVFGQQLLAERPHFLDERGRFVLSDNEGTQVVTDRVLTPAFCLKAGVRHDAVAPILPQVQAA